jgi:hypothetical protein
LAIGILDQPDIRRIVGLRVVDDAAAPDMVDLDRSVRRRVSRQRRQIGPFTHAISSFLCASASTGAGAARSNGLSSYRRAQRRTGCGSVIPADLDQRISLSEQRLLFTRKPQQTPLAIRCQNSPSNGRSGLCMAVVFLERRFVANTNANGEHQIPSWTPSRRMSIPLSNGRTHKMC